MTSGELAIVESMIEQSYRDGCEDVIRLSKSNITITDCLAARGVRHAEAMRVTRALVAPEPGA